MSTWPNRGCLRRPLRGPEERKSEPNIVRPTRSDSSQQASSKPGAVHLELKVKLALDFRQRHHDHRDVEVNHEDGGAYRRQHQPAGALGTVEEERPAYVFVLIQA